jgi:hypothetical protein
MQNDHQNGNLSWIASLLNLAEHLADQGHAETARLARELVERLRPLERIYPSKQTAEVERGIVNLQQSLEASQPSHLRDDPEMVQDFVTLAHTQLNQVEQVLAEQDRNPDASAILNAFRRIEGFASFLELSDVADLSRSARVGVPDSHLSKADTDHVRNATVRMRQALEEMQPDPGGDDS